MTEATTSVTSKVLAILDAFSPERPELTLSELAERTGLTLPTLHRRAAELVEWGALERTDVESLPDRAATVGGRHARASRGSGLRERALPFLEDLYVVTRQNVQLAVREGWSSCSSSASPATARSRC